MKFATILTAAAALFSCSEAIFLTLEAKGTEFDGKKIYYDRAGPGYGYALISTGAVAFVRDSENHKFYVERDHDAFLSVAGNAVVIGRTDSSTFDVEYNWLTYNGSYNNFSACKNFIPGRDTAYVLYAEDEKDLEGKECTKVRISVYQS